MSAAAAGMLAATRNDATAANNFLIVAPARERSRTAITATPSIATRRAKAICKQHREADCQSLVSIGQRQYSVVLNLNWTKEDVEDLSANARSERSVAVQKSASRRWA